MFASNPYAEVSAFIAPSVMQAYVIVMALLVAVGTVYDILHKKSASYFFRNWKRGQDEGQEKVGSGEMCRSPRRLSLST